MVFDELGLSEKSPTNCLKVLHSKLEMSLDPEDKKQISFIGISNWRLDAAKMNRTIFLAIPEISLDDIRLTVKAIADSYKEDLYINNEDQYQNLGKIYFYYKENIKKEFGEEVGVDQKKKSENGEENSKNESDENKPKKKKTDEFITNYHSGRDLYNIIKINSSNLLENINSDDAMKNALARNLSGLEINGESSLKKYVKDYNFDDVKTMDLVKSNIASKDTRFLLLASEKSMFEF